jgi:hypothetical protein
MKWEENINFKPHRKAGWFFSGKRVGLFVCGFRCSELDVYAFEQGRGGFVVRVLRHNLAAKGFSEDGLRELINIGCGLVVARFDLVREFE